MTRVSSARKQESSPKRGKTRIQCQARENNNPISSAGKLKSNDKRGKTKIWFQARENKNPVSSAGKQEFGVKRGKQAGSATGGKTEGQQNSQRGAGSVWEDRTDFGLALVASKKAEKRKRTFCRGESKS